MFSSGERDFVIFKKSWLLHFSGWYISNPNFLAANSRESLDGRFLRTTPTISLPSSNSLIRELVAQWESPKKKIFI
jgi:hypothetical protein